VRTSAVFTYVDVDKLTDRAGVTRNAYVIPKLPSADEIAVLTLDLEILNVIIPTHDENSFLRRGCLERPSLTAP
jgi:hypothetical protein